MKIGFVITNLAGGGAEKVVLKIGAGLADRGHDIHLVLLENIIAHDLPPELRVHALTGDQVRATKGTIGKHVTAYRLRRLMRRLSVSRSFDLVVSTLPFADEVAMLARLPHHWCRIANTLSAEIARLKQQSPHKAARRLARYRRLYGKRPLIAVSEGVAADLRGALGLTGTIRRIYNPFDFAALREAAAQRAAVPKEDYVIHVGRFAGQKRHDVLLDAWAMVRAPQRLVLLTEPAPELLAMIAARGLTDRVVVAGFQPNPYPWMAAADLLVLSSDHEGLPNVLIEALALGTPVVSTDCPSGPREIIGDAFPEYLTAPGDAAALAEAIRRALAERPDAARVDLARFEEAVALDAYERLNKP